MSSNLSEVRLPSNFSATIYRRLSLRFGKFPRRLFSGGEHPSVSYSFFFKYPTYNKTQMDDNRTSFFLLLSNKSCKCTSLYPGYRKTTEAGSPCMMGGYMPWYRSYSRRRNANNTSDVSRIWKSIEKGNLFKVYKRKSLKKKRNCQQEYNETFECRGTHDAQIKCSGYFSLSGSSCLKSG